MSAGSRQAAPTRVAEGDKPAARRASSTPDDRERARLGAGGTAIVAGDFVHVPATAGSLMTPPDDPSERAADRVAASLVDGRAVTPAPPSARAAAQPTPHPVARRLATAGPGAPLAPALRARFEPLVQRPLNRVRIHDDPGAHDLARDAGASAFTVNQDVYFARGQFAPERPAGLRLLTHELAHTFQPHATDATPLRRQPVPGVKVPPKLGKLVSVTANVDANSVTMQLDNGTQVKGKLTYNGHPKPGTYHPVKSGATYTLSEAELTAAGGVASESGRLLSWSSAGKYSTDGVTSYTLVVVAGGVKTGKVGGGPTKTPPRDGKVPGEQPGGPGKGAGQGEGKVGAAPGKGAGARKEPAGKGEDADEPVTDAEALAKLRALPPEILEILGGSGHFEVGDYDKLLAIAEKLKKLTSVERAMYRQVATTLAQDLAQLEQSIDLFFLLKDDIKVQLEAQATANAADPTVEQQVAETWKDFDESKFASLPVAEKERLARNLAAKQSGIQLKHMATHPGELVTGMVEGVVRVDKLATAVADDVKEAADGKRNGFARTAAGVGAVGKVSGWVAGVAGVLFIALMFVPGVNLAALATVGFVAGGVALVAANVEAELRIQAAKHDTDPKDFKGDVEKAAAAQTNAIVQTVMLVLHVAAKLVARIPLGAKYQNVGNALKLARTSLIKVTGVGEAFESVRSALLTRLRAARGGLPEALAAETKTLTATTSQIKGMTGTALLERIAGGDQALIDATGITSQTAKLALETAKLKGSSAVADQVRQSVLQAFEDAPKEALRQVEQLGKTVDDAISAVERAKTPAELQAALDAAGTSTSPEVVATQQQAASQKLLTERVKAAAGEGTPTETKPSQVQPAETKPSQVKPAETRPTEVVEPTETKTAKVVEPTETRTPKVVEPTEATPAEVVEPTEAKPTETKKTKSTKAKPTETEPTEAKPAETKPAETAPQSLDEALAKEQKLLEQAEAEAAKATPQKPTKPVADPAAAKAARPPSSGSPEAARSSRTCAPSARRLARSAVRSSPRQSGW
ncbi:MAG TPA: DUF4157 domain-containing protein [Solirubrobacteraceae bacterium]|nr:DUF4157 domain-containing protein [Solirubrobacteraceae bacterium]